MKAHRSWSYAPYRPPFFEVGDIYICRVAPDCDSISLEWLCEYEGEFEIFLRKRGVGEFARVGKTEKKEFTVTGLVRELEYEFYVSLKDMRSRTRLARCGASVGTVVNYLHPEDEAYRFSGRYLCSPSLVRHPDGFLLASMDLYAPEHPQNLTLIFRSDDEGKSWHYVSELFPCFWGKMFIQEGELYMLSCSTEYGDVLIGKSSDGGKSFTEPAVLLRGSGGKNGEAGWHRNPQPVLNFSGRIWNTIEYGSWGSGYHAAAVISAKEESSDLLDPDSWCVSEPVKYDPAWCGVPKGESNGCIEGSLVVRDGKLCSIMRYDMTKMKPNFGLVLAFDVNTEEPEAPLKFNRTVPFPANHSKFGIHYDKVSNKYYSIASRIRNEECTHHRNLLSLFSSHDLETWELERDIIDKTDCDPKKIGLQYVDFLIEGNELIYLCRTAMNGADSYHNSNCITFEKTKL